MPPAGGPDRENSLYGEKIFSRSFQGVRSVGVTSYEVRQVPLDSIEITENIRTKDDIDVSELRIEKKNGKPITVVLRQTLEKDFGITV